MHSLKQPPVYVIPHFITESSSKTQRISPCQLSSGSPTPPEGRHFGWGPPPRPSAAPGLGRGPPFRDAPPVRLPPATAAHPSASSSSSSGAAGRGSRRWVMVPLRDDGCPPPPPRAAEEVGGRGGTSPGVAVPPGRRGAPRPGEVRPGPDGGEVTPFFPDAFRSRPSPVSGPGASAGAAGAPRVASGAHCAPCPSHTIIHISSYFNPYIPEVHVLKCYVHVHFSLAMGALLCPPRKSVEVSECYAASILPNTAY